MIVAVWLVGNVASLVVMFRLHRDAAALVLWAARGMQDDGDIHIY